MIKEILLAIVQGVTEFLPISSSGHLALFGSFFSNAHFSLFVYLHFASLLAVLIFFRKKIKKILLKEKKSLLFILIGIIPTGVFGFLFKDFIEKTFSSLLFIGISFLISSVFLFLTRFQKKEKNIDSKSSFLIGIFQILALFPGISRSGITISSARIIGIKKEESFNFSFLMFIPLSFGAFILEITEKKFFLFSIDFFLSFVICFFVSYLSLAYLNKVLKENKLWVFGIYCFLVGLLSLILHFLKP